LKQLERRREKKKEEKRRKKKKGTKRRGTSTRDGIIRDKKNEMTDSIENCCDVGYVPKTPRFFWRLFLFLRPVLPPRPCTPLQNNWMRINYTSQTKTKTTAKTTISPRSLEETVMINKTQPFFFKRELSDWSGEQMAANNCPFERKLKEIVKE